MREESKHSSSSSSGGNTRASTYQVLLYVHSARYDELETVSYELLHPYAKPNLFGIYPHPWMEGRASVLSGETTAVHTKQHTHQYQQQYQQ